MGVTRAVSYKCLELSFPTFMHVVYVQTIKLPLTLKSKCPIMTYSETY